MIYKCGNCEHEFNYPICGNYEYDCDEYVCYLCDWRESVCPNCGSIDFHKNCTENKE